MKRGMIVDIDHMSNRSVETALGMAEAVQPAAAIRSCQGTARIRDRNSRTSTPRTPARRTQLQRLGCLQGMFGLGTDGAEAYTWARQYLAAFTEMGKPTALCPDKSALGLGRVAFGTDTNSLVRTSPADDLRSEARHRAAVHRHLQSRQPGQRQSAAARPAPEHDREPDLGLQLRRRGALRHVCGLRERCPDRAGQPVDDEERERCWSTTTCSEAPTTSSGCGRRSSRRKATCSKRIPCPKFSSLG